MNLATGKLTHSPITLLLIGTLVLLATFLLLSKDLKQTYDSRDYLQASQRVNTYLHNRNEDGVPFLHRPPLLPAYLHFFENKVLAATWLNIICFAVSLLLCYLLGRSMQLNNLLISFYILLTATAYPWLQNHFFLWTEPLFSVFILALIWLLINEKSLAIVVLICILAYFLRKAGLFLMIGTAISYALNKRFKNVLLTSLICGGVVLCWEGLTLYLSKENTSTNILCSMIHLSRVHYADAITGWLLPRKIILPIRAILSLIVLLFILFQLKSIAQGFLRNRGVEVLFAISFSYSIFHIAFFGTPDYHEAERYLSVMFPVFLLLCLVLIQYIQSSKPIKIEFLAALGLLWSSYHIGRTIYHLYNL